MLAQLNIVEIWTKRLNPYELYNMERVDGPATGGGDRYIQIPKGRVPSILKFLNASFPPPLIHLKVRNPYRRRAAPQIIDFDKKTAGRMRITNQNRHSAASSRPGGWSPAAGFPTLPAGQNTDDARPLLSGLGHVHIYLARDANGDVWAGYTKGQPTAAERALPFARIAWGTSRGGYWPP